MRIIKCDRCGAEIDQAHGTVGYVAMCAQDIRTGDVSDDNPFEGWDFCDNCMQAIHDCIKDPKSGKFEEILDSGDASKKKKPFPGSGPSIDVEKAQALRDAGWSVKQIAAELKTSEPTVRKWTREPEPKKVRPHEWAEHEPVLGKNSVPRKEAADGKEG